MHDDDPKPPFDDRTFAFVDQLARIDSAKAIAGRLLEEVKPLGLDVLIAARLPPSRAPAESDLLLHGWPPDWFERYRDEELFDRDPVAQYGRRAARPFVWTEIPDRFRRAFDATGSFMGMAREHALVDGFLVPVPGALGRRAMIGFAGPKRLDLSPLDRARIELMAVYAVRRALDQAMSQPHRSPLTLRETEVLSWAADGKSSREIGLILGIAESTVASHLHHVREKLEVDTTQHAIALAIEHMLFDDP